MTEHVAILSLAARDLIHNCRGLERASAIGSYSVAQLSRCQDPAKPNILPAVVALRLEADCGVPAFTRAMAAANGRSLDGPEIGGGDFLEAFSSAAAEMGDVIATAGAAVADGVVSPREQADIAREIGEAIAALEGLARRLDGAVIDIRGARGGDRG